MAQYTIKDLERLSGVKAHTIRIWEKRHNIVSPSRTDTNIRLYSDADLRKLINVSVLNQSGIRISRIAGMSVEEINQMVQELSESKLEFSHQIDQLVLSMVDIDEERFEKIINTLVLQHGFEETVTRVIYPFLTKIGVLWQTENITPAHEHFISNLVRQKLIVGIDGLPLPGKDAKRALLFLPEGELHEIGLLFSHYLARKNGFRPYYLGQSVPNDDLKVIARQHRPDVIITCLTAPMEGDVAVYLQELSTSFPNCSILVSGHQVYGLDELPSNVQLFTNAAELKDLLVS